MENSGELQIKNYSNGYKHSTTVESFKWRTLVVGS